MSLNTAHINGGVLVHNGETIILYSDNVNIEWSGPSDQAFKGTKHGRIYLTSHRAIYNSKNSTDPMQSFSFPFVTLSEMEIEQPIFGANYIKGKVRAQPNGNWVGEAKFKMTFKHGGAIEFGQAMLKVAYLATRGMNNPDYPPPYTPPQTQWYAAPPPAYAPPPQGYYGWAPPTQTFPDRPPTDGVFMTDTPPPYPGLGPQGPGAYPPPQSGGAYPQGGGGGYPPQQGGYPGYPQQGGGAGGYPPQGFQGGYPPQGYPQGGGGGYPHGAAGGAAGFNSADAKAAEAAQSAYYDPSRPQMAYVPPPAYYENPPSYNQATTKKEQ